eukprot:gnl/TRDRNA2_/TRDRNA2_196336_c0_seq1.p1 gnl/TRDRNA2_/TRDRNA2_196336_c0~~gnl/TRDRNA2_/TRDRNA2_196336_c0_seq1.p1  ORF type:complete len:232 (+),score=43.05 gnl/TRDRNA2_/TRDRNA2_196336_c0_seq1:72-698(+)
MPEFGAAAASPEQVRKKWDALLAVINSPAPGAEGAGPGQAEAARSLLSDSQTPKMSASPSSSGILRPLPPREKPNWDDRHHLVFSTINARMQRNTRSYFDRWRDIESYGTTPKERMFVSWQLDFKQPPPPGALAAEARSGASSPTSSQLLKKSDSAPAIQGYKPFECPPHLQSRPAWNERHVVLFSKDNHHYHPNFREYFERPRELLH